MTSLDRRGFLGAVAVTGLVVWSSPLLDPAAAVASTRHPELWRAASFVPHIDHRFALAGGGALRLVDVVDHNGPFLLIWAPLGVRRPEGIYRLHHGALGSFVLGLTLVGRSGRLQAVIDQRRPPDRQKRGQHV